MSSDDKFQPPVEVSGELPPGERPPGGAEVVTVKFHSADLPSQGGEPHSLTVTKIGGTRVRISFGGQKLDLPQEAYSHLAAAIREGQFGPQDTDPPGGSDGPDGHDGLRLVD